MAAIALPSFLSQAAKAKQTEAKNYIGSVNRAQQAYRIEKPEFASTIEDLEIGIPTATQDYTYTIAPGSDTTTTILASAEDKALREYSGGVVVVSNGQTSVASCQTKAPGDAIAPTLDPADGASCSGDMEAMR